MKIENKSISKHKMVELKARVNDHELLRKKLSELGSECVGTFYQIDTYFEVPEGRLKLRQVKGSSNAELIYYERENIAGPKQDDAFLLRVQDADDFKIVLKRILKQSIIIEKEREIYIHQGTQIHLDTVKGLGKFVEFERQTSNEPENVKKDQHVLEELRKQLEISSNRLETLSYSDLAQK
ncbi:MAG: class IV adenylate cyclase [Candidatus Bathyarchaeota archaeon]|nr:class IV adenylate cyclase [Candidatus Bathyarchaeum tardum]